MRAVIYLPFGLSIALVALAARGCRHTPPRRAAWTLTSAALVVAAAFDGALALLAWPLIARIPPVAHLGRWRPNSVGRGVPVPEVVSVAATVAALGVMYLALELARQLRGEMIEAHALHDRLGREGGAGVVVVDDRAPVALALAGTVRRRGRVVVSTALLEELDGDERAAVLAHERTHLRGGHRWFAVAVRVSAAMNPLLRPLRANVGFALERWADDGAAARTTPTIAARALAKSALASLATLDDSARRVALHIGQLGVPQRVEALLDPPRPRRTTWLVAVVVVASVAAVAWAAHDTERLFEALRLR